jgi:hypothetical protein
MILGAREKTATHISDKSEQNDAEHGHGPKNQERVVQFCLSGKSYGLCASWIIG